MGSDFSTSSRYLAEPMTDILDIIDACLQENEIANEDDDPTAGFTYEIGWDHSDYFQQA